MKAELTPEFFDVTADEYGYRWTIEEEIRITAAEVVNTIVGRFQSATVQSATVHESLSKSKGNGQRLAKSRLAESKTKVKGNMTLHALRHLELCCGNGRMLSNLKLDNIVGVDFSFKMLLAAKERKPSARFVVANARHLPFRKNAFQNIIVVNSIHHLPYVDEVLKEIKRMQPERLVVDFRNSMNPVVFVKHVMLFNKEVLEYRSNWPWIWIAKLRRFGFKKEKSLNVIRPLSDSLEGFKLRHLVGQIISFIPCLAPCYILVMKFREEMK